MLSLTLPSARPNSDFAIGEGWDEIERPVSSASTVHDSVASSSGSSAAASDSAEDRTVMQPLSHLSNGKEEEEEVVEKQQELDDLRLLAISTNITELSYSISDIQTRIFEIQEIRHQSHSSQEPSRTSSKEIDQALINLDEKLDSVSLGMKSVQEAVEPLTSRTPKPDANEDDERTVLLRKHKALVADWENVQQETEVLREELKEDKWLTVFRTVSEQADGMMTSLEKAVRRCQDFVWRVHKRVPVEESTIIATPSPSSRENTPLTLETYKTLQDSFEAKKKHYMPATSKVLSIIDKGVQDRVTKNGETLRRHADSTKRWHTLMEKIERTEKEMEIVRKILSMEGGGPDEFGSVSEGTSRSSLGYLAAPSPETHRRASGSIDSTSSAISPFRKFAKRLGGRVSGRSTPTNKETTTKTPASDPLPTMRKRQSMFPLQGVTNLATPQRSAHKHSQSWMTPESPTLRRNGIGEETVKMRGPRWNSSTKVEEESPKATKTTISRRTSTAHLKASTGHIPPVPPISQSHYAPRSLSRSSMASSRPWSPVSNSQGSTTRSSISRPSSRAQSPYGFGTGSRIRPKTPSHIPSPSIYKASSISSEGSYSLDSPPASSSILQRLSPSRSQSSTSGVSAYGERAKTPVGTPYARPPSRSMIPVPKLQFSSASRPSSAMSNYDRPDTSMSFRSSANRAQTPESTLRGRVRQIPFFQDANNSISAPIMSRRSSHAPPSSFIRREPSARPGSRAGAQTPSYDSRSLHTYIPANSRDPLDAEVAAIANEMPHGLLIERLDPPLRGTPKENEELRAQYAFSNHLARKVVACKLMPSHRSDAKRKVMCRVGGGWQELSMYILSRQTGG